MGAAAGEMLVPLLTGLLFSVVGPRAVLAVNLVGCLLAVAVFAVFVAWARLARPSDSSSSLPGHDTDQMALVAKDLDADSATNCSEGADTGDDDQTPMISPAQASL